MSIRIVQVDAFTNTRFRGNPAAVCLLPSPRDDDFLRDVAREMNLSETAFLVLRDDGAYDLRWFTPAAEVALCGHATLASAHVLWEDAALGGGEPARFLTKSGLLTAVRESSGLIEMDFPAKPEEPTEAPEGLAAALGAEPAYVGRNEFDYLVQLASEDAVRALSPSFDALARLPVRGVIVTSQGAAEGVDFVSRFFAPAVGVPEDPVTGSAHCCLAPFWAARLGRTEMIAHQLSARGGVVRVRVAGDRVKLGGHAVTVMEGTLLG